MIPYLLGLSLLTACKKDHHTDLTAPNVPQQKEVYKYQSIEYVLDDKSHMDTDSTIILQKEYLDNTSSVLTSNIIIPAQNETSQFSSNEDYLFSLSGSELEKISVPVIIDGTRISTGSSVWKYNENKTEALPSSLTEQHITLPVQPATKAAINVYAKWQKISTGYTATYKEQTTGKLLKVKGIWTGRQLKGFSTDVHAENLK